MRGHLLLESFCTFPPPPAKDQSEPHSPPPKLGVTRGCSNLQESKPKAPCSVHSGPLLLPTSWEQEAVLGPRDRISCTSSHWWCGVQRPRAHPHVGRGDMAGVTSHRHRLVRVHQGPQEGGGDRQPLLGPLEFNEPPRILTGVPETGAQGFK